MPPPHTPAETDRSGTRAPRLRAPFLVGLAAAVALVLGTVGPPLAGQGVFQASDLLYLVYPWRAYDDPSSLNSLDHGPVSDTVDAAYPDREAFSEGLRNGQVIGWNPWASGGQSLGGVSSSGSLNPFTLAYLIFPGWYALAIVKALTVSLSIGFTYLFCRRLGVQRVAAVFGGMAFAGSGFMVMWTNWPQVEVATFIPALFWATERFLQKRTASSVVPIALSLACMLLGNFPAIAGYSLYVLVPYVAIRLLAQHRTDVPRVAGGAIGAGGGLLAGGLLVAGMLLPFMGMLGSSDLSYRGQETSDNLRAATLATTVAPRIFGLSDDGVPYVGPWAGQIESVSFVGASTVLLAVLALALPGARRTPPGARTTLAAATLVIGLGTYGGGPVLGLLQKLPVFTDSFVGRTRSILGFLVAVLAALGIQALAERREKLPNPRRVALAVVLAVAAAFAAWIGARTASHIRDNGIADVAESAVVLPAVVGALTIVAIVAARFGPRLVRVGAFAALPVLLAVESLALSLPLLPNEDRDLFYPDTMTTAFLRDNVGSGRVALEGNSYYGNTLMLEGIRSATGHAFASPTWARMLREIDPDVFDSSRTFSHLDGGIESATSPALDRMGVGWFVTTPHQKLYGQVEAHTIPASSCDEPLEIGDPTGSGAPVTASASLPAESAIPGAESGLRGVIVRVCESTVVDEPATLVIEARQGDVRARTVKQLDDLIRLGNPELPLPEADWEAGDIDLEVSLEDSGGRMLPLATTGDGTLATGMVRPLDDGLRLVNAAEMNVWERSTALPRIRWAERSVVVTDEDRRAERVASGEFDDDEVVLSEGDEDRSPGDAELTVRTDSPDAIQVTVDAEEAGHLVVADALQNGWVATLDGEAAPLVDADHAGVAVAVPAGTHEVALRYAPKGQRLGFAVGAVTAVGLAALAAFSMWRRRRPSAGSIAVEPGLAAPDGPGAPPAPPEPAGPPPAPVLDPGTSSPPAPPAPAPSPAPAPLPAPAPSQVPAPPAPAPSGPAPSEPSPVPPAPALPGPAPAPVADRDPAATPGDSPVSGPSHGL